MIHLILSFVAAASLATEVSPGVQVQRVEHASHTYRVVRIDLKQADLELYGQAPGQRTLRSPHVLQEHLAGEGRELVVATNAGIFDTSHRPLGLHVEGGVQYKPLNMGSGHGNFYLKPNGVFWLATDGAAHVDPTAALVGEKPLLATQSGPLLLVEGEVPSILKPESPNLLLRSGVGVSDEHTVYLVISEGVTRFHELATLFRDVLGCTDALYLDGVISQLVDPSHPADARTDGGYAALLAVSVPVDTSAPVNPAPVVNRQTP